MNDLRAELQQADPVAREAGLTPADVDRMRRQILSATPDAAPRRDGVFLALAAALFFASIGGALLTRTPLLPSPAEPSITRQLQFSTSGGTRVIWTFNSNFKVR